MIKYLILIISVASVVYSQVPLTGFQEGKFDSSESEYIIPEEIVVPEGKTLEFLPGCKITFNPFSGIICHGQLRVVDCEIAPNSRKGKVWNGINVTGNGSLYFDNVIIKNSLFGITVPDSSSLKKFNDVTFIGSSKYLQINNSAIFVENGKPFSIAVSKSDINSLTEKPVTELPETIDNKSQSISIISAPWLSILSTLAFTGVSLYCMGKSEHYQSEYDAEEYNLDKTHKFRKLASRYYNLSIGAGIGAGISAVGFTYTVTFGR